MLHKPPIAAGDCKTGGDGRRRRRHTDRPQTHANENECEIRVRDRNAGRTYARSFSLHTDAASNIPDVDTTRPRLVMSHASKHRAAPHSAAQRRTAPHSAGGILDRNDFAEETGYVFHL